jgi:hypothetical protein|tara:strand:+ start:2813 stop:4423 length:1611 start_codon:yes stop_codon:yes gene_type:complete
MVARRIGTLTLFLLLAIVHTWPLASAPTTLSRNDNADTVLNEWILSWVTHQATRDPGRLFDANIFHPERRTLAFSEHMFVQSLLAAPVFWLGGSPVLAYNLVLILGFALTGWTMCLLIETWTGDRCAGILAGCLAAFNAHTLTRLPHLQALHFEFLPLAFLALDGLLRHRRLVDALKLSLWYSLQALCSVYLMVFSTVALAAAALARPTDWLVRHFRQTVPPLAVSALVAAIATAPFLIPYYLVSAEHGFERHLDEVAELSASPRSYISTAANLYLWLCGPGVYGDDANLFLGAVGLSLVGVALGTGVAFREPRARMLLAAAVAGIALSFGPRFPLYAWLHEGLPLMQAVRVAERFGQMALMAGAGLAGFGLATLRARCRARTKISGPLLAAATVALLSIANLEALRAPFTYTPFTGIPRVYDVLANQPNAVVAEIPFYPAGRSPNNAPYMLASTRHFKPLLNGYSGFLPRSYREHAEALQNFPDSQAIGALKAAGVTHVVVHTERLPGIETQILLASDLVPFVSEPGIRIYTLER